MYTLRTLSIGTITAAALIASANVATAGSKFLTGDEIATLYTGNSFTYWGKTKGTSSYRAKTFSVSDKTNGNFAGTWWIEGDKYCRKFDNGNQHCDKIKDKGNGVYTSRGYKFKLK